LNRDEFPYPQVAAYKIKKLIVQQTIRYYICQIHHLIFDNKINQQKLTVFSLRSKINFNRSLAPVLSLTVFLSCGGEQLVHQEKYHADPNMGDWQGILTYAGGSIDSLAVQVIGYENRMYRANFSPRFDTRDQKLVVIEGKGDNQSIQFTGTGNDLYWEGILAGEKFSGTVSGAKRGTFSLHKVIRNSPTLGMKPPEGATVLFDGQSLSEWEHARDPEGYINLNRFIGGENRVAYLRTGIWSESDRSAILEVGSDDGVKLWWNDAEVLSSNQARGAEPGQEKVHIQMKSGWNRILLKINNGAGGWGAYIRMTDSAGMPLNGIKSGDPADPSFTDMRSSGAGHDFIARWQLAGPYMLENVKGVDLFDQSFEPELSEAQQTDWRWIDSEKIDYHPEWTIQRNVMRVKSGTGNLISRRKFNDAFIHIEFRSPYMPSARGQKRGNSGVYVQGRYEIQVLDSYGLEGEDNECGGIYKVSKPRVNMCAPPIQWQTYDIDFTAPKFGQEGEKVTDARITVRHNGILIHEHLKLPEITGGALDSRIQDPGGIMLQDHGDPVEYRNIWIIPR